MIDTHCHLLPGLDDGARSLAESVSMARRLTSCGVTSVVCTPHLSPQFPLWRDRAVRSLQGLQSALAELEIQLDLTLAAEVHPTRALGLDVDELRDWTLNGRFLIVELLDGTRVGDIDSIFQRLIDAGMSPVFAHPERCHEIQAGSKFLDDARADGAVVQIVSPSLTGAVPSVVARTAWDLINRGVADVVASDGHRATGARLRLDALAEVIATRVGREVAQDLLTRRPARLLAAANGSGDATRHKRELG
jgi:protein-tyrosine phosphatase